MLDENLAKSALSARVVLQVEPVEPVKRVFIGVHVLGVHVAVVRTEVDRLEHLALVQKLAGPAAYLQLLGILKDFRQNTITVKCMTEKATKLFDCNAELISGFNGFVKGCNENNPNN